MNEKLKLVGAPEEEAPPQRPPYPHTNIQFTAQSMVVSILFTDDIAFTKVFDRASMEQIRRKLNEIAKQEREQAEMVRRIEQSKQH